jgi:hypothetical protein
VHGECRRWPPGAMHQNTTPRERQYKYRTKRGPSAGSCPTPFNRACASQMCCKRRHATHIPDTFGTHSWKRHPHASNRRGLSHHSPGSAHERTGGPALQEAATADAAGSMVDRSSGHGSSTSGTPATSLECNSGQHHQFIAAAISTRHEALLAVAGVSRLVAVLRAGSSYFVAVRQQVGSTSCQVPEQSLSDTRSSKGTCASLWRCLRCLAAASPAAAAQRRSSATRTSLPLRSCGVWRRQHCRARTHHRAAPADSLAPSAPPTPPPSLQRGIALYR